MAIALSLPAKGFESDPSAVDQSVAITIGDFEVSHYIVDKNYNQFLVIHRQQAPSQNETANWFRLFLAQQAIKGDLYKKGYLDRSEVSTLVAQMSRYTLTQPAGPFYKSLYDARPIPADRLQALYENSGRVFDAMIVRFDDEATARRLIGSLSDRATLEQRLLSFASTPSSRGFDVHNGRIVWPYHPFQEMASDLFGAKPGALLGPLPRKLGVYFLLVRQEARQSTPDFAAARPAFERYVRDLDELTVRRLRRKRILEECDLAIDLVAVDRLNECIRASHADVDGIQPSAVEPIVETRIASYVLESERHLITAENFVRDFNERLFRQVPHSSEALAAVIEDFVIEEYDYRSARRQELDQQPKFVQDRLNFALNQALALYEKETLATQLVLSPDELRACYAQQRDRYSMPVEATGAVYIFADHAGAVTGLSLLRGSGPTAAVARAQKILDPVVVRRDGPSLAPGVANSILLQLPDGQAFGPFGYSGQHAIFVKRSTGQPVVIPLADIEDRVRRDLLRTKLDQLELDLFRRSSAALRLRLDLAKYGIEAHFPTEGTGAVAPPPSASLSPSQGARDASVATSP